MSTSVALTGHLIPWAKKLADTSDQTIATGSQGITKTLESVMVSADATGDDFSLWASDGTIIYYLANGVTVSQDAPFQIKEHPWPILPGWSLKCKAATGGHLDVTAVLIQSTTTQSG